MLPRLKQQSRLPLRAAPSAKQSKGLLRVGMLRPITVAVVLSFPIPRLVFSPPSGPALCIVRRSAGFASARH
jgi:hypothetical protein